MANKPNNKVKEMVEQSIRKYFSVITPNAGLLKGKEQIAGTITLYMLKNFVLGEIAKVCDTSSYEQGCEDERERIIDLIENMKIEPEPQAEGTDVDDTMRTINNTLEVSEGKLSKFSLNKTFKIKVPDFKLSDLNKKDFYFSSSDITDDNFPTTLPKGEYQVKIFNINETVSSEECLEFLKQNNCRLVSAQGLGVLWKVAKDQLPKGKWIVSFDEKDKLWKNANGFTLVPHIFCRSDGAFVFPLGCFENDWGVDGCVIGFCDY